MTVSLEKASDLSAVARNFNRAAYLLATAPAMSRYLAYSIPGAPGSNSVTVGFRERSGFRINGEWTITVASNGHIGIGNDRRVLVFDTFESLTGFIRAQYTTHL